MLVWLASYPRSGNTLLRMIVKQAQGAGTYSLYDDLYDIGADTDLSNVVGHVKHGKTEVEFTDWARRQPELIFAKTHEPRPPAPGDRAIYIVRDGRAATFSYWRYHREILAHDVALLDIIRGNVFAGDWSGHVLGWLAEERAEQTLLVRFEDLIADPAAEWRRIAEFLGLSNSDARLQIDFNELNQRFPHFFRSGSNDRNILDTAPADSAEFQRLHGPTMEALGYGLGPARSRAIDHPALRRLAAGARAQAASAEYKMNELDLLSPFLGQNWYPGEERLGLTFRWTGPGQVASVIWGRGLRTGDALTIEIPRFAQARVPGNLRLVVDGIVQDYAIHDVAGRVELRAKIEGLPARQSRSSILFVVDQLEPDGGGRPTGIAVTRIAVRDGDPEPAPPRAIEQDLLRRWQASSVRQGEFLNWSSEPEGVRVGGVLQQSTLSGTKPVSFAGRLYSSTGKLLFEFNWAVPRPDRLLLRLDQEGVQMLEASAGLGDLPIVVISEMLGSVSRLLRVTATDDADAPRAFDQLNDLAIHIFRHVAAGTVPSRAESFSVGVPGVLTTSRDLPVGGQLERVNIEHRPSQRYHHVDISILYEAGRLNFVAQHLQGKIALKLIEDPWLAARENIASAPLPISVAQQSTPEDQRNAWASISAKTRASIRMALALPQIHEELMGKLGSQDPTDWLKLLAITGNWLSQLD